jgi:hypothetical protein
MTPLQNGSSGRSRLMAAVYVAEKGKPLATPAP